MKRIKDVLFSFFLIAAILVIGFPMPRPQEENTAEAPESRKEPEEPSYSIHILDAGAVKKMELERYITGVVLAEMPADFELEALKAQAVVARTFAWKAQTDGGKHGGGAVCTDASCCQGFLPEERYLEKTNKPENLLKIRDAVQATRGCILAYDGFLIEATYFSCSGGSTEDAAAVWGNDYPYLTAKESPGEESAFCFRDAKSFTKSQLEQLLHILLDDSGDAWFQNWEYTNGNGVATVEIGGKRFDGTRLRQLLGLRSTNFTVTVEGDAVTFHTLGYGHRVGMSQYGADAMAASGKKYTEILAYYYEGTDLQTISRLQS